MWPNSFNHSDADAPNYGRIWYPKKLSSKLARVFAQEACLKPVRVGTRKLL